MADRTYEYDLIVIGCGPGGEKAATQAAYFGKRVVVIEKEPQPGGAAVHWGTLPSKTLRESCLNLSGYRKGSLYGLPHPELGEIAARDLLHREGLVVQAETARIVRNLERHRVDLVRGTGSFIDAHTVAVATPSGHPRLLRGDVVLIATGSRPERPASVPFDHPDVHDSDSILRIERIPERLIVLGGGVIGCEYASMFAAMGVQVTLLEARDRLLAFLDGEIVDLLVDNMRAIGVDVRLGVRVEAIEGKPEGGVAVTLPIGAVLHAEALLFSGGRRGNTEALGLDAIGLEADARGRLAVNEHFQTAVPNVYAVGDVIGFPALAATAMEQGRVAVRHAFQFAMRQNVSPLLPYGIYTVPAVSMVGESEESCRQKGLDYEVGRAFYRDNARARIIGDDDGMLKLIFERRSHRILGVHLIGERATELVHIGVMAMELGGTLDTFIETNFNYPTLSELYKYAAYNGLGRLTSWRPHGMTGSLTPPIEGPY